MPRTPAMGPAVIFRHMRRGRTIRGGTSRCQRMSCTIQFMRLLMISWHHMSDAGGRLCAQVERARGVFRRIVLVVRNGYVGHGIANVSMNPGCIRRYLGWAWRARGRGL